MVYPVFVSTRLHKFLGMVLEKSISREPGYNRLVLHAPPQVGKSLFVSKIFPSWYRGKYPNDPIIITAYGDSHAQSFSRAVRNIVNLPEYQFIFPGVCLATDSQAVEHWELSPPYTGEFHAAGIRGAITGKGAKLMIIDDPLKDREEAESKTIKQRNIDQWNSTLSTRLHDDSIVIVMATRWAEDDLPAYLLKHGNPPFKYIRIPALCDMKEGYDPLGRRLHESIWSNRFPQYNLIRQRDQIGPYDWSALYQGDPTPLEGKLFKKSYFQVIPAAPEKLHWVRYWDLATSTSQSADYTACVAMAKDNEANVYLRDMVRGKWEWPDVRAKIKATTLADAIRYPGIFTGIEAQGTQKGMIQEIYRDTELMGLGIIGIPVTTDKRIRALPVQSRGAAGKLYLVENESNPWVLDYIEEMCMFDGGEHDDQVDTTSGGMAMLTMTTGSIA